MGWFDGHNGYITASYLLFFALNAVIIGGIFWRRQRLKEQLSELDELLKADDAQAQGDS